MSSRQRTTSTGARRIPSFADIGTFIEWRGNLTGIDEPVEVALSIATATFFSVLGVPAELGRVYTAEEDVPNGPNVAVLSRRLWERQFGARPRAIGTRLSLNGRPFTIIGVMPAGFGIEGSKAELWTPMGLDPAIDYRTRTGRYLTTVARLKPDVTRARAQTDMTRSRGASRPSIPSSTRVGAPTSSQCTSRSWAAFAERLLVLAGVVAFVLLIACANVANLLLARSTARTREIAVRSALGAGRGRVVRQLLTESVVLAIVGGAVGLLLAYWGLHARPNARARGRSARRRRLRSTRRRSRSPLSIALVTGLLFGLVPALHAGRGDLQTRPARG